MRLPAAALFLAILAGCATWAEPEKYTWAIKAPATVARGEDFRFEAEAKNAEGAVVDGLRFTWSVDWPQLKGAFHTGATAAPQSIRAKGAGGKGLLRIYARGPEGGLVQVAKAEFDVH